MRKNTWAVSALALLLLAAPESEAAAVAKINRGALDALRRPANGAPIRLAALPLSETAQPVVQLEEFFVWSPMARVVVHSDDGVQLLEPPPMRFFRGGVEGDAESFAYFAVSPATGEVDGLISTREKRFALNSARRARRDGPMRQSAGDFDDFLTEVDDSDLMPGARKSWQCAVDQMRKGPPDPEESQPRVTATSLTPASQALSGSQSYAITLEIETDFAFYTNAGSNVTAATEYITNLTGALATIYKRDLNTEVVQADLHIYTSEGADPWESTSASAGLSELGDEYHNNILSTPAGNASNRTTSAVTLLSGEDVGSGIAWEGQICRSTGDFFQGGHWGGAYSWAGGIGALFGDTGLGTIPDPDATNGVQYGMPSGLQNYWPLTEYAHELGHNLGGHHTHCVPTSDAERIASGFTDGSATNSTSNQVDHCFGGEGLAGCFSGANYASGSQTMFRGTIMSYCHNVFAGEVPQSRFVFGVASEPSQNQFDDYMFKVGGPQRDASLPDGHKGGAWNLVRGLATFSTVLTAPTSVDANSTGNAASVAASPSTGATYAWVITNGTITSGQGTSAITFTAGASGTVVLKAYAYMASPILCGISETKNITINSIVLDAPGSFTAVGIASNNVSLTWGAVTDALEYEIHRTSLKSSAYSLVGTTANAFFNDLTVAANTSYLYKVRAKNGGTTGPFSGDDIATAVTFTDDPLTAGVTDVKLVHFTELLTAVNALRTLAELTPLSFTAPTPSTSVTIRAQHLVDLRTGANQARASLGRGSLGFEEDPITAEVTTIKKTQVSELRGGVQ